MSIHCKYCGGERGKGFNSYRKIQQDTTVYQNLLFHIYVKLSMFRATHTAHHQEPKTALAAYGFAHVEGCWTCGCWTLSGSIYAT